MYLDASMINIVLSYRNIGILILERNAVPHPGVILLTYINLHISDQRYINALHTLNLKPKLN